ncbi:MAG: PAS domain S-box protein [Deltaproteobacteria bacterium]|nr:PAS domain S-box protein [Deltaproteobacteria bacterium]
MVRETEKSKILIVDDDENFTTVTSAFLESQGYTIYTAVTGQEALEKASSDRPEIVLLDLILPDAEGTEILKRLRQIDRNLAVITVTGYGDEHRAVNVMKAGSCDYLTKPFRFAELVHSIEKASMWREVQIIDDMSEGYLALDNGKIAFANRSVYDLLGYSREEITGMDLSRLFPKEGAGTFERQKDASPEAWRTLELEAVHHDGSRHTLMARIGNDTFQGRKIVALVFKDITATKHLEAALEETQTLYENLILNANDAITLIDPEGTFALVNPKFCEISGYSEGETKTLHFSKLIHPEDLPLFADHHRRRLAGEDVPSNDQFRMIRKTGEVIFVDFNASVVKKEGKIIGIQAIARDITERKQAEKELQDRMTELEKWHKLTIDRELRMIELKKKIEELETQLAHLKKLKGID